MAARSTIRAIVDRALGPLISRLDRGNARLVTVERRLDKLQTAIGTLEARRPNLKNQSYIGPLGEHEFSAFSQWGEDGIIAWLVRTVDVGRKVFVEFGVGDYSEANTRFLAEHDNWTGLLLDASRKNVERIRSSEVCWRQNLRAIPAWVTRDNINRLLSENGFNGDIGLLSIDVDGNDYWVWKAIDTINPAIVVVEYNYRFGSEHAITIPYEEHFRRGERYPIYYFGASLKALCMLGSRKGYAFIGCNGNGVNAFFVRRDRLAGDIRELTPAEGYAVGTFTELRDELGFYVPASPEQEMSELMKLPLVTVTEIGETDPPL